MQRLAAVILLVVSTAQASVVPGVGAILKGRCPPFTTQENFDVSSYVGRWYEIQKFFTTFEGYSKCIIADYSPLTEDAIQVVNSGIKILHNEPFVIVGNATATDVSGQFDLYFPGAPPGDYNVLSTDYTSYTTIYSCGQLTRGLSIQYAWVLSRTPTISPLTLNKALNVFKGFGIDTSKFRKTIQDDSCVYRPEPSF